MAKKKCEKKCKYCECKIVAGDVCSNCKEKLSLVRKLLGMVKYEKEKVERDRRIQEDLERARDNDR